VMEFEFHEVPYVIALGSVTCSISDQDCRARGA
jgi:hypothetical protein